MPGKYGYTGRTEEIMAKLTMTPEEYEEFLRQKEIEAEKFRQKHEAWKKEQTQKWWEDQQRLNAQKAEEERLANDPVYQEQQRIKSLSESGETLFDNVNDHYKVAVYESDQYIAEEQRKIKEEEDARQRRKRSRSIRTKVGKVKQSWMSCGLLNMWRSRGFYWLKFDNWISLVLPYYLMCGGLILLGSIVIGVPLLGVIIFFWPDSIIIQVLLDIIDAVLKMFRAP